MRQNKFFVISFLIFVCIFSACKKQVATTGTPSTCQSDNNPSTGTIHTNKSGVLQGVKAGATWSYQNVRYANPMTPATRWTAPVLLEDLSTISSGSGVVCAQPTEKSYKGQEDCLSVNVWTPTAPAPNTPVMVFIHGGAYVSGSGSAPVYDGANIASQKNAIVVTMNYRLGILGFLNLNTNGIQLNGNYGILDQQTALTWVKNNINCFNGNANNITIFGESAGAASVLIHTVSAPASQGLFNNAIIESDPVSIALQTPAEAQNIGATEFYNQSTCAGQGLACLQALDVGTIESLQMSGFKDLFTYLTSNPGLSDALLWQPVVDGTVITSQPITQKIAIPAIIGTNHDEGIPFGTLAKDCIVGGSCDLVKNYLLTLDGKNYEKALGIMFGDQSAAILKQYPACSLPLCNNVPVLSQVITDYVFTCGNRYVANNASSTVYAYQFSYASPVIGNFWGKEDGVPIIPLCGGEVCHAQELPYVFQNGYRADGTTFSIEKTDLTISNGFMSYWNNFATNANPGSYNNIAWTAYGPNSNLLLIDNKGNFSMSGNDPFQSTCSFWDSIGYPMQGRALRALEAHKSKLFSKK